VLKSSPAEPVMLELQLPENLNFTRMHRLIQYDSRKSVSRKAVQGYVEVQVEVHMRETIVCRRIECYIRSAIGVRVPEGSNLCFNLH
jgi:hypothetical protein